MPSTFLTPNPPVKRDWPKNFVFTLGGDFNPSGSGDRYGRALGYLRVMFTVEDIDDTLARLGKRGAELVGKVAQYEDTYRLCYIRGPEGILIGLAQELGQQTSR